MFMNSSRAGKRQGYYIIFKLTINITGFSFASPHAQPIFYNFTPNPGKYSGAGAWPEKRHNSLKP
jgi:hypothetical protein